MVGTLRFAHPSNSASHRPIRAHIGRDVDAELDLADRLDDVVADVRQFMGGKVYDTMIPRNVRISEAPSYGKPVLVYDLKCVGSEAYLKLATEVIQRERELRTH